MLQGEGNSVKVRKAARQICIDPCSTQEQWTVFILIIRNQITMNTKSISINYRAVIVTGIIAFILSLIWYSPFVFGKIWMEHRHAPIQSSPSWTMIFAPLRELIASYVMALLITRLTITDWKKSVRLTFLLWITLFYRLKNLTQ